MTCSGYRLPQQATYEDTFNFLTWEQFPVVLESSIRYFSVLPETGIYRHVNNSVKPFMQAIHDTNSREFTLSGVGSLFDYDLYGHQIKRPSPQLVGTGCNGNSLCLEPVCFGFTEGVIESNNILQNMCWSLSMPCLKDMYYSDRQFMTKMNSYFKMFFKQAPAVLEAYQRTRLLKEAVKIVCTDTNFRFSGPVIGGANGLSLPFYINPTDATAFPDLSAINAGVGGANLMAFVNYLAPRLFSGSFSGGMEDVTIYGLKQDYMVAKEQTASVQDHFMDMEMMRMMAYRTGGSSMDRMDSLMGTFVHDGLFPTFTSDTNSIITPITQEILEASTIAGYVQTSNPEHSLAPYRALLFVPKNWMFTLVEPPKDDFSDLGIGNGLNFRTNTPGVYPVMSSSMFSRNTIQDRTVILGQGMGPNGMITQTASGLRARGRAIPEAVRTEVLLTYSSIECNNSIDGQLPVVGRQMVNQSRADGFRLKSTMYIGTDVVGTARPVLLIFKTDTPRSARPIEVCDVEEVEVTGDGGIAIESCCPGNQIYAVLTFSGDASSEFTVEDTAVYRTGARGNSYLVEVTAVSGNVVTIQSEDGQTLLPCCSGSPDDYGTRGELINTTGITALSSEIFKAQCENDILYLELFTPIADSLQNAPATITLENGDVINVLVSQNSTGVFVQVQAAQGEACDLCADTTCNCLVNAVFELTVLN